MPTKHAPATSLDVIEAFLHAANAYPKLVGALRSAMDAISAEYCGHDGQCGADVKGCYVRKFAALMRELGED